MAGVHIRCCNIVLFTLGNFIVGAGIIFAIIYGASGIGIAKLKNKCGIGYKNGQLFWLFYLEAKYLFYYNLNSNFP